MTNAQLRQAEQALRKAERRARFEQGRASVQLTKRQRNGRAYNRAAAKREVWA